MAEVIQKKSVKHDPAPSKVAAKTSCFLGCFRFSKGVSNKKPTTTTRSSSKSSTLTFPSKNEDHKIKDIKSTSGTTPRRRWFLILWSSWRFRNSMKSATKTVPIDTSGTVGDKRERPLMVKYSFIKTTKSKSKSKSGELVSNSEREIPATADGERRGGTSQIEAEAELPPVSDVEQIQLTPLTQKPPDANTINLENRGHLEAAKDNTCHNKRVSFCRNIDSLRSITGGAGGGGGASSSRSQTGSPVQEDTKSKAVTRTAPAVMSQSAPFPKRHSRRTETPASAQNKHYSSDKAAAGKNSKGETSIARTIISNKKLDPLVGMSIIMVTLIIMLLWGRLCAILCTSAWFYFLPRLKSPPTTHHSNPNSNSSINNNPSDLDLNSEEYKKKVVLEGFLERNHRNIL